MGHIHTISIFYLLTCLHTYPFLFNHVTLFISETAPNLHVLPKTEICLDFSIKNAGFVFAVEICDFSVLMYNFYSSSKYIFVEVSFVQRN